jgi:hypothetical protein
VPKIRKELRQLLGLVNYYQDMVPNKAALCAPMNSFTSISDTLPGHRATPTRPMQCRRLLQRPWCYCGYNVSHHSDGTLKMRRTSRIWFHPPAA